MRPIVSWVGPWKGNYSYTHSYLHLAKKLCCQQSVTSAPLQDESESKISLTGSGSVYPHFKYWKANHACVFHCLVSGRYFWEVIPSATYHSPSKNKGKAQDKFYTSHFHILGSLITWTKRNTAGWQKIPCIMLPVCFLLAESVED